ncbi:NAD(P)/FAD-dependent oxidoreductase [Staphylococcus xylosus]|uniref:NAD(P)/FAD-dependent oxidoreductase n=1 Tax=Staphylococcus xylosus TaxID=1288 RepID=UPI002DBEBFD7|nr:NAD(P)/FAD-dependent oxidoreductase [Staphylococcus xylosus]MEB8101084.1 NAD(P)-binding domain-containing protein [Staphylococcus xylosus]
MLNYKAIVIGAGPAGIGMTIALNQFGIKDTLIIEKEYIGSTFQKWPVTTKFITPSFTTNSFGMPDINAITPDTSPAYTFKKEHISGKEYQEYLQAVSSIYELNINENTCVNHIEKVNDIFKIYTNNGTFNAKYLFVATGDFNFPYKPFEIGQHYSEINNFEDITSSEVTVLGANESGIDSAINLAELGKKVTIITKTTGYDSNIADPSISLSPYTSERFKTVLKKGYPIRLLTNREVSSIQAHDNGYKIHFNNHKDHIFTEEVIQATGFSPTKNPLIQSLFEVKNNEIHLTSDDESTRFNNIFLTGSVIENEDAILCYIYKFRARFAVLASILCSREKIKVSEDMIDYYKRNQMFLDDYSCCEVKCTC